MRTSSAILAALLVFQVACVAPGTSIEPEPNWTTDQAVIDAKRAIRRQNIYLVQLGTIVCPDSTEVDYRDRVVRVPVKLLHCGCEVYDTDEFNAKHEYADAFNGYMLRHALR